MPARRCEQIHRVRLGTFEYGRQVADNPVGPLPRINLTLAASQIAQASCSPYTARAWASDCRTTIVLMPVPPPSDISEVSDGSG